jgi:hypothetical protein
MVALAALFVTRVLTPGEIGPGIPWALAMFVGGMLSLTAVMSTYKINVWLGSYIVPAVQPFVGNPFLLVLAISAAVAAMRFVDQWASHYRGVLSATRRVSGASGRASAHATAIIMLPTHVFWFNYQNIWIAMTEGISKSAYTDADRMKLATVFIVITVVALWIAVGCWRAVGIW